MNSLLRRALLLLVAASGVTASRSSILRAAAPAAMVGPSGCGLSAEQLKNAPNPEAGAQHDILLRAAKGEAVERTPVWLMRQAGRYQPAFREYSNKIPFRERSETPDIAIELSLQPWRAFGVDGVIMFSDILTPLPAIGVDFDVVRGTGPVIPAPLRTAADVAALTPLDDPDSKLPFIRTILGDLRKETEGRSTLLGFVGAPFTLVAYSVEGQANRHCIETKKMMTRSPEVLHAALSHLAETCGRYACHQIECGAQCVQFFESWAHHLGAGQFATYAKPYANMAMQYVKERYPDVPIVYYANGGSPYLDLQADMACDIVSLDWSTDMKTARGILGADRLVQGNVDPTVLFGSEQQIAEAVHQNIADAGGPGKHLLNLGHGVLQGTPEEAVAAFVDAAKTAK